mmetsp:Transcript_57691/g.141502  ORF Transcript_57691/g.141502 Transcript_57691/m.141502 type:complete len:246 (+) Transcript_57691:1401-2138(+)
MVMRTSSIVRLSCSAPPCPLLSSASPRSTCAGQRLSPSARLVRRRALLSSTSSSVTNLRRRTGSTTSCARRSRLSWFSSTRARTAIRCTRRSTSTASAPRCCTVARRRMAASRHSTTSRAACSTSLSAQTLQGVVSTFLGLSTLSTMTVPRTSRTTRTGSGARVVRARVAWQRRCSPPRTRTFTSTSRTSWWRATSRCPARLRATLHQTLPLPLEATRRSLRSSTCGTESAAAAGSAARCHWHLH